MQTFLGEVHDCDVWAEHLDAFAVEQRERIKALFGHAGRFARLQPGIDYLRQDRRHRRQEVFAQLVAYWNELDGRRFWERLTSVVLARGQTPAVVAIPLPVETRSTDDFPPAPESRNAIAGFDGPITDSDGPSACKPLLTAGS